MILGTHSMKIDLQRFQGRELSGDAPCEQRPVAEPQEGPASERGYGWEILIALIAIGWALATISWTALLIYLGFCTGVLVLLLWVANWSLNETW
jgi:hypothetical protein